MRAKTTIFTSILLFLFIISASASANLSRQNAEAAIRSLIGLCTLQNFGKMADDIDGKTAARYFAKVNEVEELVTIIIGEMDEKKAKHLQKSLDDSLFDLRRAPDENRPFLAESAAGILYEEIIR